VPRLSLEIITAVRFEKRSSCAIRVIRREGTGPRIVNPQHMLVVHLCRQAFELGTLAKLPGHSSVVFGVPGMKISAMPGKMVGERRVVSPGLACLRGFGDAKCSFRGCGILSQGRARGGEHIRCQPNLRSAQRHCVAGRRLQTTEADRVVRGGGFSFSHGDPGTGRLDSHTRSARNVRDPMNHRI